MEQPPVRENINPRRFCSSKDDLLDYHTTPLYNPSPPMETAT